MRGFFIAYRNVDCMRHPELEGRKNNGMSQTAVHIPIFSHRYLPLCGGDFARVCCGLFYYGNSMNQLQVEYRETGLLIPYARNARTHSDRKSVV